MTETPLAPTLAPPLEESSQSPDSDNHQPSNGLIGFLSRVAINVALGLIWFYQRFMSPLLPPACRFYPSCSAYSAQALRLHGFWRGLCLSAWRLLRCHPFSRGGYDPVPDKKTSKK